jgi:DNA-binding CsgD family transcriptional regulator/tetratricopeptide (TPR) repeat protein
VDLLERDGALAALREAWARAARGEGRAVVVSGEPGIGKTALISRFTRDLGPAARVLLGTCDDLTTPRPLGPIRDLIGKVGTELAAAVEGGAAPHEIQRLLLAELERPPRPTMLVLEDVHWADDATLDAIGVIGRRIGRLPAVLVLTVRGGEAPAGHPLHTAIAAVQPADAVYVELAPLSAGAVASLAGDARYADEVFQMSAGNPFYVSELIAAGSATPLPPSIANAVLARASRLGPQALRLMELVSVVPSRLSSSILDAVMPDWTAAAEEPERHELLEVHPRFVRFRHELARHAIRSSIPIARQRRLHGEILAALLAADADPADIVHHAEAAGDEAIVADHTLLAARHAAALESNREAYAHYRRAADFLERRSAVERAQIMEGLAVAAYGSGRLDPAFVAVERAIAEFRALADLIGLGRCTRFLSRLHWYSGHSDLARRAALEAIAILEPLGDSPELARAISERSQLAMLAEDVDEASTWGRRALEMAVRVGDERTRAHAMINVGTSQAQLDPTEFGMIIEAHAIADAAGDRHEATRALINVAYTSLSWVDPAAAAATAERALAYAESHEVDALAPYISLMLTWMRLRTGHWSESEGRIRRVATDASVVRIQADTILAELAIRRGDPDALERLDALVARADRTAEAQRIQPALELATEWAILHDGPPPVDSLVGLLRRLVPADRYAIRTAAWAAVAGVELSMAVTRPAPHAAMLRRDWRGAADAFGAIGWTYDRALMLSLLDDEAALHEAIEIARGLGAEPLVRRVAGRLRDLGFGVPRGRRVTTRSNPAGLTDRQLEVVALLVDGATNQEIADRLVLSPRTAEHHVAAVLDKLGATTRREAARRAADLGLAAANRPGDGAVSDG